MKPYFDDKACIIATTMKSIMNDANTTPLLSQTLDDEPQLDLDIDKKVIEGTNVTRPNQQDHHSWLVPFLVNIFLANTASSVILPILAPYLQQVGVSESYLPLVIFIYHLGNVIGSLTTGLFYDYATQLCKVEGRVLYTSAEWIGDAEAAKWFILCGRLVIGFWRGGQTTVEQAYLSAAVEPSVKTEYTASLATSAVLGTITGPIIGALFSQVSVGSAVKTLLFFDSRDIQFSMVSAEQDNKEDSSFRSDNEESPFKSEEIQSVQKHRESTVTINTDGTYSEEEDDPSNGDGIVGEDRDLCFNTDHEIPPFNTETITTPMVMKLYDWSATEINLLFAGAGGVSVVTSLSIRYVSRCVRDRKLLIAGIMLGLFGTILQMDIPQIEKVLPVGRFVVGIMLTYMSFPVRKIVVKGLYSNILGPSNQGRWVGFNTAAGAMARAFTPFIAWQAMQAVNWNTWLNFGVCSLLLLSSLAGTIITTDLLVPYSEFVGSTLVRNMRVCNECHEACGVV
eukprot:scaffold261_cov58-Cyclotella_meneghiniana.AAC.5